MEIKLGILQSGLVVFIVGFTSVKQVAPASIQGKVQIRQWKYVVRSMGLQAFWVYFVCRGFKHFDVCFCMYVQLCDLFLVRGETRIVPSYGWKLQKKFH